MRSIIVSVCTLLLAGCSEVAPTIEGEPAPMAASGDAGGAGGGGQAPKQEPGEKKDASATTTCQVEKSFALPTPGVEEGSFRMFPKVPNNEFADMVLTGGTTAKREPPALMVVLSRWPGDDMDPTFKEGFKTGTFDLTKFAAAQYPALRVGLSTADQEFRAVSGTVTITQITPPVGDGPGRFSASLENAKFQRVHAVTGDLVQDGCETTVAKWAFDKPIQKFSDDGAVGTPGAP